MNYFYKYSKLFFFISIFFVSTNFLYPLYYPNPGWSQGRHFSRFSHINQGLLHKPIISFKTDFPLLFLSSTDYISFYPRLSAACELSYFINPEFSIGFSPFKPQFLSLSVSQIFQTPILLDIKIEYLSFLYPKLNIFDHSFSFSLSILFDYQWMPKWFEVFFSYGLRIRFLNIHFLSRPLIQKQLFPLGMLRFIFHPLYFLSISLFSGNDTDLFPVTANLWMCGFSFTFHLPYNLSLYAGNNFIFHGSFPFAGSFSQLLLQFGIKYVLKI